MDPLGETGMRHIAVIDIGKTNAKLALVDASLQLGWGQLAGFLTLVFAASVLLYHGLEKPAQRWLNRHPPRWAERAVAQPAE